MSSQFAKIELEYAMICKSMLFSYCCCSLRLIVVVLSKLSYWHIDQCSTELIIRGSRNFVATTEHRF